MDFAPFLGGEAGGAFVDLIPCTGHRTHTLGSTLAVAPAGQAKQAASGG